MHVRTLLPILRSSYLRLFNFFSFTS